MSATALIALLQSALLLLTAAQSGSGLPQSFRDYAVAVAQQAISQATQGLQAPSTSQSTGTIITTSSQAQGTSTVRNFTYNGNTYNYDNLSTGMSSIPQGNGWSEVPTPYGPIWAHTQDVTSQTAAHTYATYSAQGGGTTGVSQTSPSATTNSQPHLGFPQPRSDLRGAVGVPTVYACDNVQDKATGNWSGPPYEVIVYGPNDVVAPQTHVEVWTVTYINNGPAGLQYTNSPRLLVAEGATDSNGQFSFKNPMSGSFPLIIKVPYLGIGISQQENFAYGSWNDVNCIH